MILFSASLTGVVPSAAEIPADGEEDVVLPVGDENAVVQGDTQEDEAVPTTATEPADEQIGGDEKDIAGTAGEQPAEAPTEPEETPYRDKVPVVETVSFSSGSNENTLTLYTDSTAKTAQQYEMMQKYGNLYRWYYKTGSGWKYIGSSFENSFMWYPTERGRSYTFTVRCADRDENRFISDFDRTGYTIYYCRTPGSLKAEVVNGSIRFSFDQCYGVNKYAVYRKVDTGWKRIGVTRNNYYIDADASAGADNTYTVRCINNSENVFWSNFKHAGVSIYLPDYSEEIRKGRDRLCKLIDHIADDIEKYPNGYYARPDIYWEESSIPKGAQWCVAFPHYVLNKGLGGYYACQWEDVKPSPSYWNPYTSVWSRDSYYNGKIFYQPWDKVVPAKGDIIFFRHTGEKDVFANIGHVGVVLKIYGDGSIDTLEGNIGTRAVTSRVRVAHYTKSGNTWRSDKRIVSGFIDLSKVIENGKKYNQ